MPIVVLLILTSCVWFLGLYEYISLIEIKQYYESLRDYIQANYIFALLMYMVLYISIVATSLPGAATMTILGGLLFDQLVGTIAVVISATLGATLVFLIVKFATSEVVEKKTTKWIVKMQEGFNEAPFNYLLFMRLMPIFPFFAINLAAAVLQVRTAIFFWATLLGIIPGTFVYITLGSGLQDLGAKPKIPTKIIFGLIGLAIIVLMPVLYKRLFRSKLY